MNWQGILLISIAAILFLVGIIGCLIPGLPGTPLCWVGLLIGHFINTKHPITVLVLAVTAIACIIVELVNNFIPSLFTKQSGGSRAGSIGSTLGVFAGVFTGQILLIFLGPFIGALIGEILHDSSDLHRACRSACYAFLGFITGTGLRLIMSGTLLVLFIRAFF